MDGIISSGGKNTKHMNEKLQAAKDHAAMELYFCDYQQAIEENQLMDYLY